MTSATIKLFLLRGHAKSLRTGEISNWSGKAIAASRTELDELLGREELDKPGVYILTGSEKGLLGFAAPESRGTGRRRDAANTE